MAAAKRPTAGKKILGHLEIDDDALAAFLPKSKPPMIRAVFWCQFDTPLDLDGIKRVLASVNELAKVTDYDDRKFPPGGPEDGVEVRVVAAEVPGRYVSYGFYGMRGETYESTGRIQLEATFREMGRDWGSNQAVYERFKRRVLPLLKAKAIEERTE